MRRIFYPMVATILMCSMGVLFSSRAKLIQEQEARIQAEEHARKAEEARVQAEERAEQTKELARKAERAQQEAREQVRQARLEADC